MLCSPCIPSSCVRCSIVASSGDSHVTHLRSSSFCGTPGASQGVRETPGWADHIAALEEKVFILNAEGKKLSEDDPQVSEEFRALSITVQVPHIHFV